MSTPSNSSKWEVSSSDVLVLPMLIPPDGQIFTVKLIVPLPLLLSNGEKEGI